MMLARRLLLHSNFLRSGLATQTKREPKKGRNLVRFASLIGGGVLCYYAGAFVIYRDTNLPVEAPNTLSFHAYRLLPLNLSSRIVGSVASVVIPESLRTLVFGTFVRMYGCNLEEAEDPDLKHYPTLSAFFRRSLKADARPVDASAELNSPCDGRVLFHGEVRDGQLEQIKGITYSLWEFFGDKVPTAPCSDPQRRLFHIVLYLAPGDYHRFHAPIDWTITSRRYFPGYLLSVKPRVAEKIRGLFSINERAVYFGQWRHGFFSYTPVGATNVGTIRVFCDSELVTNVPNNSMGHFQELEFDRKTVQLSRGELFGEFNLGSTIVLIFEAPKDFEFCVAPGEKVICGQALAK